MKFSYFEVGELFLIGICLIFLCMFLMSAGCVTATKNIVKGAIETPTIPPTPNITLSVTATPTPLPTYAEPYSDWKYRTNGHNLQEYFSWRRDDVSGLKDMLVHVTTYGYQIDDNYQYWDVSWGKYFWQVPGQGMKYVFVFVDVWMDGNSPQWDPRMYGFDWNIWRLQVGTTLYAPDTEYSPPDRIRELEETWDNFNASRIGPFGYLKLTSNPGNAVGGQYVRMGKENGLDGFVLFQVPKDTKPEDMKMVGSFRGFGSAWWQL